MSAQPDLLAHFRAMETILDALPEGTRAEIARGVYAMSPRPRTRHGVIQGRLFGLLHDRFGRTAEDGTAPDWLFAVEPEIRREIAFSRLIPDLAGWRRSTGGWPDLDETPVSLVPDWVAEILSPSTEGFDRGAKLEAYGLMGVAWHWLLDPVQRSLEVFENVRGRMVAGPVFGEETFQAPPFDSVTARFAEILPA